MPSLLALPRASTSDAVCQNLTGVPPATARMPSATAMWVLPLPVLP